MRISDTEMTSERTRHTARAWPVPDEPTGWSVTWLPGRNLTRNQAVTAMTIAESVDAALDPYSAERVWPHIAGWAAELGLSDVDAVAMASLPPEHYAPVSALAEIRWRECPLCQAAPGEPCQPNPAADHLARWLDAYTAGKLTRAYMALTVGELVVIDVASTVIGSAS